MRRGEKRDVVLELLRAPEHGVSAVQIVQDAQDAVHLIELEVVEIVRLGRRHERKVVTGVRVYRVDGGQCEPRPNRAQMRPEQKRTGKYGESVAKEVLHGMTVEGRNADWSLPLVMQLMEWTVQGL